MLRNPFFGFVLSLTLSLDMASNLGHCRFTWTEWIVGMECELSGAFKVAYGMIMFSLVVLPSTMTWAFLRANGSAPWSDLPVGINSVV